MSQEAGAVKRPLKSEVPPHQLGQEVFKTILLEDVDCATQGASRRDLPEWRRASRPPSLEGDHVSSGIGYGHVHLPITLLRLCHSGLSR
jgi:hypothetical protein